MLLLQPLLFCRDLIMNEYKNIPGTLESIAVTAENDPLKVNSTSILAFSQGNTLLLSVRINAIVPQENTDPGRVNPRRWVAAGAVCREGRVYGVFSTEPLLLGRAAGHGEVSGHSRQPWSVGRWAATADSPGSWGGEQSLQRAPVSGSRRARAWLHEGIVQRQRSRGRCATGLSFRLSAATCKCPAASSSAALLSGPFQDQGC